MVNVTVAVCVAPLDSVATTISLCEPLPTPLAFQALGAVAAVPAKSQGPVVSVRSADELVALSR